MRDQKGIAHLLLIIIVLAGIALTVFLVKYPQIFKPKADESTGGTQINITGHGSDQNESGAGAAGFDISGSGITGANTDSGAGGAYITTDGQNNVSVSQTMPSSDVQGSVGDPGQQGENVSASVDSNANSVSENNSSNNGGDTNNNPSGNDNPSGTDGASDNAGGQ